MQVSYFYFEKLLKKLNKQMSENAALDKKMKDMHKIFNLELEKRLKGKYFSNMKIMFFLLG